VKKVVLKKEIVEEVVIVVVVVVVGGVSGSVCMSLVLGKQLRAVASTHTSRDFTHACIEG
jgi:hypothetical protein